MLTSMIRQTTASPPAHRVSSAVRRAVSRDWRSWRRSDRVRSIWARLLRLRPALPGWYVLWILVMIQTYVLAIFLPQRLAQIGIHAPVLVSIYAVVGGAVVTSLVGLAYGRMRARLSYAVLLRIAFRCSLAGFLVYGTVSQPVVLLLAPALFGLGNGILFPVVTVMVDQAAGVEHRSRAASLSGTAIFAGQFVSPLLFGPLIDATSTTTGFLVAAGVSAAILAVVVARGVAVRRTAAVETAAAQGTAR